MLMANHELVCMREVLKRRPMVVVLIRNVPSAAANAEVGRNCTLMWKLFMLSQR